MFDRESKLSTNSKIKCDAIRGDIRINMMKI